MINSGINKLTHIISCVCPVPVFYRPLAGIQPRIIRTICILIEARLHNSLRIGTNHVIRTLPPFRSIIKHTGIKTRVSVLIRFRLMFRVVPTELAAINHFIRIYHLPCRHIATPTMETVGRVEQTETRALEIPVVAIYNVIVCQHNIFIISIIQEEIHIVVSRFFRRWESIFAVQTIDIKVHHILCRLPGCFPTGLPVTIHIAH